MSSSKTLVLASRMHVLWYTRNTLFPKSIFCPKIQKSWILFKCSWKTIENHFWWFEWVEFFKILFLDNIWTFNITRARNYIPKSFKTRMHFLFGFKAGVRRKRIILVTRTSNSRGLFWDLIGLLGATGANRWDTVAVARRRRALRVAAELFSHLVVDCSWAFTLARTNNLEAEEPRTLLSLFYYPASAFSLFHQVVVHRGTSEETAVLLRRVHKFVLVWKCLCNKKVKASDTLPWDWSIECVIHFF